MPCRQLQQTGWHPYFSAHLATANCVWAHFARALTALWTYCRPRKTLSALLLRGVVFFWLLSNIIEATVQKCQTSLWELFVMDGLILHRQPYHYVGFARIEIFFGCGRPGMALGGKYTCQTFYNPHWPVYRSPFMAVAGDGRSWEGMGFHSPWPGRISIDRLSPIFLRAEQADAEIDPRFAQSRNARAEHQ